MSAPVRIVCRTCGSDDILSDAWARWNVETQQWELSSALDNEECCCCEGETHTIDVPIDTPNAHEPHKDCGDSRVGRFAD